MRHCCHAGFTRRPKLEFSSIPEEIRRLEGLLAMRYEHLKLYRLSIARKIRRLGGRVAAAAFLCSAAFRVLRLHRLRCLGGFAASRERLCLSELCIN